MKNKFFENFFFFIIQKVRILVFFIVCTVILSVIYCSAFIEPKYRATATAVISLSEEYVENATQSLVQTQAELTSALVNYLDEDYVFKNLSQNLPKGLSKNYTQSELQQILSTTSIKESFVLKATASAPDPNDAALLCNAYITQGLNITLEIVDIGYWEMVESATPPRNKYYPSYLKAAFYGILIGIASFCTASYVFLLFNNRIVSRKELEDTFPEIPVLSEVAEIPVKENE